MKTNCFLLSLAAAAALPGMAFAQSYLVDPSNTASHVLEVAPGGKIGIGTSTPAHKLDVNGNAMLSGTFPFIALNSDEWDQADFPFIQANLNVHGIAHGNYFSLVTPPGKGFLFFQSQVGAKMVIDPSGNVGIGTSQPSAKLHLEAGAASTPQLILSTTNGGTGLGIQMLQPAGSAKFNWQFGSQINVDNAFEITPSAAADGATFSSPAVTILANGKVGIGSTSPGNTLEIAPTATGGYLKDTPTTWNGLTISQRLSHTGSSAGILFQGYNLGPQGLTGGVNGKAAIVGKRVGTDDMNLMFLSSSDNGATFTEALTIQHDANVGIGTTSPQAKLDVAGTIKCQVLDLSGADLAEKFDISGEPSPGTVVCADPERDGQLCVATREYDDSVIGVIGGAGGITPGLLLHQPGVADGAHAVAMVGRVYVLADATFGEIKPGAALTTSPTPGHAMKATDKSRSTGTILGTALSTLKGGQGLVLVAIQRR